MKVKRGIYIVGLFVFVVLFLLGCSSGSSNVENSYTVSGRIETNSGQGIDNVELNLSGQEDVIVDGVHWQLDDLTGDLIITPQKEGYYFYPDNIPVFQAEENIIITGYKEVDSSEMSTVQAGIISVENDEDIILGYAIEMAKYEVTNEDYVQFLNDENVISDGIYSGKPLIDLESEFCQIGHDGSDFYVKDWDCIDGIRVVDNYPVNVVTWYGAVAYCNWLSEKENLDPAYNINTWELKDIPENLEGYRLPTAEECEYIARGGEGGMDTQYSGSINLEDVGWYEENSDRAGNTNLTSGRGTMPVGQKAPNELGIYDMSGNVREWTTTTSGSGKFAGGGMWNDNDIMCHVDMWYEVHMPPGPEDGGFGFRVNRRP